MGGWVAGIAVVLAVWVVVALLVGLLIGGTVRYRDRQVPREGPAVPAPRVRGRAPGSDGPPEVVEGPRGRAS